jgi:very-short-patch-repair endonuclease
LGAAEDSEILLHSSGSLRIRRNHPLFDAVQKMQATATLNPYEREVLYGYPYLVGRRDGETIRGPLLTVPVAIEVHGDGFLLSRADDVVHFNALPFKAEEDLEIHEQKIARIISSTPSLPLTDSNLNTFADALLREFKSIQISNAKLDGSLIAPPPEPAGSANQSLSLIDQAALFIAPKTSYFLASDLARLESAEVQLESSALGTLLRGPGPEAQVDLDDPAVDSARLYFPFPSNRSQRRAALLVEDTTTRVIRVEGPPGTGKSLTISNLACHLAASGKTVLISSQKDKALQVVDAKLRELGMAELPMTLLHRDRESKGELLRRLDNIKKERSQQEVSSEYNSVSNRFLDEAHDLLVDAREYSSAMATERVLERLHREVRQSGGMGRLLRLGKFWRARWALSLRTPRTTDAISEAASARRKTLLQLAVSALQLGREMAVSTASREERGHLRELAAVLKRDESKFKNFSLFDRLKGEPERSQMLLKLLPVWLMTPDDAARLFPCVPGLFDVVIVDEASQVDLPSITPIAYRGKKLVIFGDSRQMQPRRFAFMSQDLTRQAWHQYGMDQWDEDHWLHPTEQNLLSLAAVRAEEEALLDEHFRSLPPIIEFSNRRWYDSRLRIMTDSRRKRFGGPEQSIVQLHFVHNGKISNDSQENEEEARSLVQFLVSILRNPDYEKATVGVMCLFEEQVALVQEIVNELVSPDDWEKHNLVVINPDGFQGDERDVILYSLSYDAKIMPQSALSARMSDQAHVQGMLNVAFTRARDEIHIFHSAPIGEFTFADRRPGAITDWLRHCAEVETGPRERGIGSRFGNVDSKFEADVAEALRARSLRVLHQYPACGFSLDLVAEETETGARVAVECDGERYHLDEHGQLRIEDIERQAILERAGWRVVRIPYRKWIGNSGEQISRVLLALSEEIPSPERDSEGQSGDGSGSSSPLSNGTGPSKESQIRGLQTVTVTKEEQALIEALRHGSGAEAEVFLRARDLLGSQRLTEKLRNTLRHTAIDLARRRLLAIEEMEYFLLPAGRNASLVLRPVIQAPRRRRRTRSW